MASAQGVVLEGTPVAVDRWRRTEGVRLFFLTHAHADHTVGLGPSWAKGTIYCTPVTAALVTRRLRVDPARVVTLELGAKYEVPLDELGKVTMAVTVFDANHCPGAAMYLFEGYFGTVLCTGDFRYDPALHDGLARHYVDRVYLDNTFLDPAHRFPSRATALRWIEDLVLEHFDAHGPASRVAVGLTNLGKEAIVVRLAAAVGSPCVVRAERAEGLRDCGVPSSAFVVGEPGPGTAFHACFRAELSALSSADDGGGPWLKIVPSAWRGAVGEALTAPVRFDAGGGRGGSEADVCYQVPYSDHSSFDELVDFVRVLAPGAVTPIVTTGNTAVSRHLGHLVRAADGALAGSDDDDGEGDDDGGGGGSITARRARRRGAVRQPPPSVVHWMMTAERDLAVQALPGSPRHAAAVAVRKRPWTFSTPDSKRSRSPAPAGAPASADGAGDAVVSGDAGDSDGDDGSNGDGVGISGGGGNVEDDDDGRRANAGASAAAAAVVSASAKAPATVASSAADPLSGKARAEPTRRAGNGVPKGKRGVGSDPIDSAGKRPHGRTAPTALSDATPRAAVQRRPAGAPASGGRAKPPAAALREPAWANEPRLRHAPALTAMCRRFFLSLPDATT